MALRTIDPGPRLLLQHLEPVFLFSSIVIVEPMLSPEGPQHLAALRSALVKGAYERRDVWADRSQAMAALRRRDRTKRWDPRVLDLYVVRIIHYIADPNPQARTEIRYQASPRLQRCDPLVHSRSRSRELIISPTSTRVHLVSYQAMYRDEDGPTKPVEDLNKACVTRPVHLVLGVKHDLMWVAISHTRLTCPQTRAI